MGENGSFWRVLEKDFLPWTNNGGGKYVVMEAMSTCKTTQNHKKWKKKLEKSNFQQQVVFSSSNWYQMRV